MAGTTYTRTDVRHEGLRIWPSIGWFDTADFITATGVVDVSRFDHAGMGSNEFSGYTINRYNRTGNDKVKKVGKAALTQSTGTLAHDSATVYVDTTDLAYEILGVDPEVLDNGIAQAQQKRYTSVIRPLTRARDTAGNVADMDMQSTGVLMWGTTAGSTSNATPTKVTSADDVTHDVQALKVALSVANGYVRSAKFRVNPNQSFATWLLGRADVGTLTFKIYDETNGAYIMTANDVAYTGEQFAWLKRVDVAPSGCEEVSIEIRGTGSSDVLITQSISGPWPLDTRRIELPQWLNEQYKLRFLKPATFTALAYANQVYDAESRQFMGDYQQPQDFFVETFHRDVAAYHIQIVNEDLTHWLQVWPLYISAERSRALDEPLTTEAGTTTEDALKDLMNYVLAEWASALSTLRPDDPKWKDLKQEYQQMTNVSILATPPPPKTQKRGITVVRI